jgi:hypothetical protein
MTTHVDPKLATLIQHLKRDNIHEALEIAAAHGWGSREEWGSSEDPPSHPNDGPTVALWRKRKSMEMDAGFGPIGSSLTMELGLCGGTPHCRVSGKTVPVEVFAAMLLGLYDPPAAPPASAEASAHAHQLYEAIVALSTLSRLYSRPKPDDTAQASGLVGRVGASLEIALEALHKAHTGLVGLSACYDKKEKP